MHCKNFDLCNDCESHCNHDQSHAFVKIKWQINNTIHLPHYVNEFMILDENAEVSCDNCHKFPISGFKYKCGHCENFNLCDDCEPTYEHNPNHAFIKYSKSIKYFKEPHLLPIFY
ncbi:Transcription related zf-ZZ type zinc finger protein [Gigaspora margarita]|uniref:Transcription related zf-ZZ type zinc finger protein n=1 Tax=Gigaspora margarita TaxID=4874 RepID=A0A8H4B5A2_GIGMA|nr:Transcription related zf-ZZ type zinc finger protein [Gigaspora margarita]